MKTSIAGNFATQLLAAHRRHTATGMESFVNDVHSAIEAAATRLGDDENPTLFTFSDGSELDIADMSVSPARKKIAKKKATTKGKKK